MSKTSSDEKNGGDRVITDGSKIQLEPKLGTLQTPLLISALESAANPVVIADRSGCILWVNQAFSLHTGFDRTEMVGRNPRMFKSGYHSKAMYRELWDNILAGRPWSGEICNKHKDGSLYTEEMTITPVKNEQGEVTHFIAIKQAITSRKRHEEQIRHQATHDPLTNLPNRRLLDERIKRAVQRAGQGVQSAICLVDLDDFKLVNDTFGHAVGDEMLASLAATVAAILRPGDLIARLGGDEFALLLEDISEAEAKAIAEQVRQEVSKVTLGHSDLTFTLRVTIGIGFLDRSSTAQSVMAQADSALYAAKELGKNRVETYSSADGSHINLAEAGCWAMRIKEALRGEHFVLHFQPVVQLASGDILHFEVLLRMRDEHGNLIMPALFLKVAERFGLMPYLDRWVVGRVIHLLQMRRDLSFFVNLSGASLSSDDLLRFIEEQVQLNGLRPGQLVFEITETVVVKNLERIQLWMNRLRSLGCQFALDDFGTGFSSFAYLQSMPVDYVKIDGSFVRNVDTDPTSRALMQAITTVAQVLGKEVICECVERLEIIGALCELGIRYGQGFALGMPKAELPDERSCSLQL